MRRIHSQFFTLLTTLSLVLLPTCDDGAAVINITNQNCNVNGDSGGCETKNVTTTQIPSQGNGMSELAAEALAMSALAFYGAVANVESFRASDDNPTIMTEYQFDVLQPIRGVGHGERVSLYAVGGRVGDVIEDWSHVPSFVLGERAVVFAGPNGGVLSTFVPTLGSVLRTFGSSTEPYLAVGDSADDVAQYAIPKTDPERYQCDETGCIPIYAPPIAQRYQTLGNLLGVMAQISANLGAQSNWRPTRQEFVDRFVQAGDF